MSDRELVDEFLKNRSEKAFSNLYRTNTPRLYQMALRLTTHNQHLAEELIQEMWFVAIKKIVDFEWRSELTTWLTGILINLSREKRKQARKEIELHETLSVAVEEPLEEVLFTTDDLEKAIALLSPGYRQVILLHDIEGYKHKQIAELLDVNEGTSKSQLFHARKVLRIYLKEGQTKKSAL